MWARGQQAVLVVRSAGNDSALADITVALVQLPSGAWHVKTDKHGRIHLLLEQPTPFRIMAWGYEPYQDTLQPGVELTVLLQPKMVALPEVVVIGQIDPLPVHESVLPVRILDQSLLRSAQVRDLGDALKALPFARPVVDELLGTSFALNGLSGEYVKILVDGVPVVGREHGRLNVGQLRTQWIERLEVVEGPMSALYGTDALGGLVHIITKPVAEKRFWGQLHGYLDHLGTADGGLALGGRFQRHSWELHGERHFFPGVPKYDSLRYQWWKPEVQYNGMMRYQYRGNTWKIMVKNDFMHQEIRNKGLPVITPYQAYAFDDHYRTVRLVPSVFAEVAISPRLKLHTWHALSTYVREKNFYRKDLVTLTATPLWEGYQRNELQEWLARTSLSGTLSALPLKWLGGYEVTVQQGAGTRLDTALRPVMNLAAFLSAEWQLGAAWSVRPAVRLTANTMFDVPPVPSLHLRWQAAPQWIVRASVARGFRSPSLKELYMFFVDNNHFITGNGALQPETSWHTSTSVTFTHDESNGRWEHVGAVSFHSIDQQIRLALVDGSTQHYTYVNLDHFSSRSLSFTSSWQVMQWQGMAGVTLLAIADRPDTASAGATHVSAEVTTSVRYRVAPVDAVAALFFRRVGASPVWLADASGQLRQAFVPAFYLVDLTFVKSIGQEQWQLGCGVKNLLNVKQVGQLAATGIHSSSNQLFVSPGRVFFLSLQYAWGLR